jgi:DNA polymerase IIIc chi subunit
MIEIEIKTDKDPRALAELIDSAVNGQPGESVSVTEVGKQVREVQERQELARGSWTELETVNFATLDAENDWSDV